MPNDAASIYFADARVASALVARRCAEAKVETAGGVSQVRKDEPASRDRGGTASDAVRVGRITLRSQIAKELECDREKLSQVGLTSWPHPRT